MLIASLPPVYLVVIKHAVVNVHCIVMTYAVVKSLPPGRSLLSHYESLVTHNELHESRHHPCLVVNRTRANELNRHLLNPSTIKRRSNLISIGTI